jgi:hypothetical protein
MVRREEALAEVVPIATRSPTVVCLTKVPVSVQPAAAGMLVVQERAPEPSVKRTPLAVCEEGQVYVWVLKAVVPVAVSLPEMLRLPLAKYTPPMVEEAFANILSNNDVEEAVIPFADARPSEKNVNVEFVDEARERYPPVNVESPVTERVPPS